MVARGVPPADLFEQVAAALSAVGRALFAAWQRSLDGAYRAVRSACRAATEGTRRWTAHWALVRRYYVDPADPRHDTATRGTAAAFGLRAFAFGMLASGALAVATGDPERTAIAAIIVEVIWAAGRFAVCAAILPATTPRDRLLRAYLAGLVPYAFGLTATLRWAALAASAVMTARGLRGTGVGAPETRSAVAWAFGGQVAVVALGFVARAGLALLTGA